MEATEALPFLFLLHVSKNFRFSIQTALWSRAMPTGSVNARFKICYTRSHEFKELAIITRLLSKYTLKLFNEFISDLQCTKQIWKQNHDYLLEPWWIFFSVLQAFISWLQAKARNKTLNSILIWEKHWSQNPDETSMQVHNFQVKIFMMYKKNQRRLFSKILTTINSRIWK